MKPLPRLLAFTDDRIAMLDDIGVRAAALAAAGPSVGLIARRPAGNADDLTILAARLRANSRAPMAHVLVTGRADIARAVLGGVVLRRGDLAAHTVRPLVGDAPILASVHSREEAVTALEEGADGIVLGTIWESASHPGRDGRGLQLLRDVVEQGAPVWAIGGVTPERAHEARAAGAYGVAAIRAAWDAESPYHAALELTAPWREVA